VNLSKTTAWKPITAYTAMTCNWADVLISKAAVSTVDSKPTSYYGFCFKPSGVHLYLYNGATPPCKPSVLEGPARDLTNSTCNAFLETPVKSSAGTHGILPAWIAFLGYIILSGN